MSSEDHAMKVVALFSLLVQLTSGCENAASHTCIRLACSAYEGFHVLWCYSPLTGAGVETVPACVSRKRLNGSLRRMCMWLSWWMLRLYWYFPRKLLRWSLVPSATPLPLKPNEEHVGTRHSDLLGWARSLHGTEKSVRNTWGKGCRWCTSDRTWELGGSLEKQRGSGW